MSQLHDLGAALLVGLGQLAVAIPIRVIGGQLLAAVRTRYVRKPHLPHRTYASRIDPTGPAGRHRLTLAARLRPSTRRPVVPAAGHVRWHGHPDDTIPSGVLAGIWTEAADA